MRFLSMLYSYITAPFRLLSKFLTELLKLVIEVFLPDPMKETTVIVSLYALLKDIRDPCNIDFSTVDKDILDRLIYPDAIKLPISQAPYIWARKMSLLQKLKEECSESTTMDMVREYAEEFYRGIPYYLRTNVRRQDTILAFERVICLTCNVPACVVNNTTPEYVQFHPMRRAS